MAKRRAWNDGIWIIRSRFCSVNMDMLDSSQLYVLFYSFFLYMRRCLRRQHAVVSCFIYRGYSQYGASDISNMNLLLDMPFFILCRQLPLHSLYSKYRVVIKHHSGGRLWCCVGWLARTTVVLERSYSLMTCARYTTYLPYTSDYCLSSTGFVSIYTITMTCNLHLFLPHPFPSSAFCAHFALFAYHAPRAALPPYLLFSPASATLQLVTGYMPATGFVSSSSLFEKSLMIQQGYWASAYMNQTADISLMASNSLYGLSTPIPRFWCMKNGKWKRKEEKEKREKDIYMISSINLPFSIYLSSSPSFSAYIIYIIILRQLRRQLSFSF